MFEDLQQIFNRFGMDIGRTTTVLAIVYALGNMDTYLPEGANFAYLASVFTSTSIVLLISLFSHIIRRIFFPEIDLSIVAKKAMETELGSAIVFLSVCTVLATLVVVNVSLLS